MSHGNGHSRLPIDVIDLQFPQVVDIPPPLPPQRPLWPAIVMFLLTVLTTLAVGSQLAASYANNQAPFSNVDNPFTMIWQPIAHPAFCYREFPSRSRCSEFFSPTKWDITSRASCTELM